MAARAIVRGVVTTGRCVLSSQKILTRSCAVLQSPALHKSHFHTSPNRFNENIVNIQDPDDFKTRVLESEKPVIVDFHATWCGPCKLLGPRLESMSAVGEGRVLLAKVDIDHLQDVAIHYGVEAVPTVCAMKNGKVQDKFVGVKEEDALGAFVDKLLLQ